MLPLSFLIPSTSGRGAVVLPLFKAISQAANDRQITRDLAVLIPTIILVSTISTLVGAGSHLIANDLLGQIAKTRVSFAQWALWGVPFGLTASFLSCAVVLKMFLNSKRRAMTLDVPPQKTSPLSRDESGQINIVENSTPEWDYVEEQQLSGVWS